MTPGRASGQGHPRERAPPAGAEVLARLPQGLAHPVEGDEEREDHQRQVVVDDADEHRGARVEDVEGVGGEVEGLQDGGEPALRREDDLPADGPDEEVRPVRHHDERDEHPPPLRWRLDRHPVGRRHPDGQAEEGAGHPDPQGVLEGREEGGRERLPVAVEREHVVGVGAEQARLVPEAEPHDRPDRDDEEGDEPQPGRQGQRVARRPQPEGRRPRCPVRHPPPPWPCSRCRRCAAGSR